MEGKLLSWTSEELELEVAQKAKGKKPVLTLVKVKSTEILKAKVTVSFK
jgi:hypothetical protein